MRIAIVAGVARSLVNFRGQLLQAMVKAGHEVWAYAPNGDAHDICWLQEIGVAHQVIPLQRTGLNPVEDLRTYIALRKHLATFRPDKVLLYTIKPVIYGSLAASAVGVEEVYSMITGLGYALSCDSVRQSLLSSVVKVMYRHALAKNKAVFFQNPDDRRVFIDDGLVRDPEHTVLINGSGVDLNHFHTVPPVTEPIVFLLIARLLRSKGIYEFVEAARIVKEHYPNAKFRIVGPLDTNPSAISKEQVRKWHDRGIVEYAGPTRDVRPFIAEASVYVLPSYREGTPRTVLEAMAMGRPIITTDAPGCRETTVHGKNGFLVPVKDIPALARAMLTFIEHPDLIVSMGKESRKIAEEKYDVNKVNRVIMNVMGL